MIRAVLELPPSANHAYEIIYRKNKGRTHTSLALSEEGIAYRKYVWTQLFCYGEFVPKQGTFELTLSFYFPDNRSDLDNRIKHLVDSMALVLGFNDWRITKLHASKAVDKANPRVEVELRW